MISGVSRMIYLDKHGVAERLSVPVKTAAVLMMQMNPIAISGTVRKRYRVSEESLDLWMANRSQNKRKVTRPCTGTNRKLTRR